MRYWNLKLKATIVSIALISGSFGALPAWSDSYLAQGIAAYNCGHFEAAVDALTQCIAEEGKNPVAHYYLANSMAHLGMDDLAKTEYQICYSQNPSGQMGSYCLKALMGYHKSHLNKYGNKHHPQHQNQKYAQAKSNIAHTNPYCSADVSATKTIIRRQAENEKSTSSTIAKHHCDAAIRHGEWESKRIADQAKDDIENMYRQMNSMSSGKNGSSSNFNPSTLLAKIEQIKQESQAAQENAKQSAKLRAATFQKWAQHRHDTIDEVASNLELLLEAPMSPSGVKLMAQGTNLYVRNFAFANNTSHSSHNLNALSANQGKLHSKDIKHSLPMTKSDQGIVELSAENAKKLNPKYQPYRVVKTVKGKLVQE